MKNRPQGVSLLITILFVTAFLLVIMGLAQSTIFALRDIRDFARFDQSLNLARGISDLLQLHIEQQGTAGIGLEIPLTSGECSGSASPTDSFAQILCSLAPNVAYSFELRPRPTETLTIGADSWFSIPAPDRGVAAANCEDSANSDDPCHWNVISPGETIEIPLFYNDAASIVNTIGSAELRLRIRTPGGIMLYTPDPALQHHWRHDPTLVSWQIIAEDDTLKASQSLDGAGLRDTTLTPTSEIYATRINNAFDHIVLRETDFGETTNGDEPTISAFLGPASRPYLQLQLNTIPKKAGWDPNLTALPETTSLGNLAARQNALENLIPYLEYQLLVSNNNLSDEKRIAKTSITIGDFTQTYEKTVYLVPSGGETALEDL